MLLADGRSRELIRFGASRAQNVPKTRAHALPLLVVLGAVVADTAAGTGPDQQKRPSRGEGRSVEPPIGIEPMTYSLRVNRSGRLS